MSNPDHRYPIGPFKGKDTYEAEELDAFIQRIASLPDRLAKEVDDMTIQQLDTPYREGGWTVRQVIHHLADSHINAYVRMKWTLTEDTPLIKAYDEKAWAETEETKQDPLTSLVLLKALHARWAQLMKSFTAKDLKREFTHPETRKNQSLGKLIALYAWHGDHHLAHITSLKKKKGWA
ncbi:MAG: putative metal-dependent hydrolase [Cyclobacteriaceae bacterium]|nr:putative metal-dependent hydrolase [Cyclobacteriaceae bacterium]MCB0498630.1 putative metal-dependent hydrolase [Cyclobacteriaceae bacterium]MCB9236803.1 putative metal-dependent hydrolase [Flammeovirgaceae bacterium]MCO5271595.1 putative metal-dependent hydrolase [Cyclobacteriaceae bacterium]MCW5901490.1 putative metal-dependent hydrolase [Cyclobacteriaceae bacterium]